MATARQNVFDFNHIDTTLSKGTIEMLKNLYAYYHRKHYGYEKLYRGFQRKNLLCNIVAGKAIITSAVAGGITLNPIVFASLTGFSLVVKAVAGFKKFDKKAEKANFARVEYKKKSLMRFGFISEANLLTKKPSSTSWKWLTTLSATIAWKYLQK